MKKALYITIAFLMICSAGYSQGFDWQYSSRMPSSSPVLFAGLSLEYNYMYHFGSFRFVEKIDAMACCEFDLGYGTGTSIGLQGEYWINGEMALTGGFYYKNRGGRFTAPGDDYPVKNGPNVKTEWRLETDINYLTLNAGAKYRLFNTHFTFGAGLQAGILISDKRTISEVAIDGTQLANGITERNKLEGELYSLSPIVISPTIRFGYDFSFGLGFYASPTFFIDIPIMNAARQEEFRSWGIAVSFTAFRGLR